MTDIGLFTGGIINKYCLKHDYFVGVDRANLFLMSKQVPIILSIGDFDSVTQKEYQNISAYSDEIITLPTAKNDTDTAAALKAIFSKFPDANVTVYGAFGGRLDHFLSNLFFPSDSELFPFLKQITLYDQQNIVSYVPKGRHTVKPINDMTYVSFMPVNNSNLIIENAKYPLNESNYFKKKMYSSNEFIGKDITVTVDKDYLVIVYSKDL